MKGVLPKQRTVGFRDPGLRRGDWTSSIVESHGTLLRKSMKQLDPVVPLRAVYLAPTHWYMRPKILRQPTRVTFELDESENKPVPSQMVTVIYRFAFAGSWMLMLLVGRQIRWEHELDVKLWKRVA